MAFSLRAEQPACEADHPPLASTEVKDEWSHNSTPPYVFMLK